MSLGLQALMPYVANDYLVTTCDWLMAQSIGPRYTSMPWWQSGKNLDAKKLSKPHDAPFPKEFLQRCYSCSSLPHQLFQVSNGLWPLASSQLGCLFVSIQVGVPLGGLPVAPCLVLKPDVSGFFKQRLNLGRGSIVQFFSSNFVSKLFSS